MNRPFETAWRSLPIWARFIGLRANATAMPVPSSIRSVLLRGEEQREERVVGGLGRPDPVVALVLELLGGARRDPLAALACHRCPRRPS